MTFYSDPLVRLAATVVVVANLVTAGLLALDDGVAGGAFIALTAATVGPLLILLTGTGRTTWVLPAFVTALIGLGALLGAIGLGAIASGIAVVAFIVAFLTCVAGTLAQAQGSLEEPSSRF